MASYDAGIPTDVGTTTYKDSLLGSWIQKGYDSTYHDAAVRRVLVKGVDKAEESLQKAIWAYVDGNGLPGSGEGVGRYHPITGVPLSRIRITRISATRAMIEAFYQRRRINWSPPHAQRVATYRLGAEWDEVYTSNWKKVDGEYVSVFDDFGLPAGDWNQGYPAGSQISLPKDQIPKSRPFRHAIVQISIPTRLSFNPMGRILGLVHTVNDDTITLGTGDSEVTFARWTMRFDGASVNWVETGGGQYYYAVEYLFSARTDGWGKQKLESETDPANDNNRLFSVSSFLHYPERSFGGDAFPY